MEINKQAKEGKNKWTGLRYDPQTGKFEVSVTVRQTVIRDSIDDALEYIKSGSPEIDVEGSARDRNVLLERGQDVIKGVKSEEVKKKIRHNKNNDDIEVEETVRTKMLYDTPAEAMEAINNIDDAKEESSLEGEPVDKVSFVLVDEPGCRESDPEFKAVGSCTACDCYIFPPYSEYQAWMNRQIPADLACPNCGRFMSEEGAFRYTDNMTNASVEEDIQII